MNKSKSPVVSLYELIKQTSQAKGRPLKIIADWDEVIQPLKVMAIYELRKIPKFSKMIDKPFPEFFKRFWEISVIKGTFSSNATIELVEGTEDEKKLFAEYVRMRGLRRGELTDYEKSFYSSPEWIETITNAPFLSIAEELLLALKEGLIERLILISSYRKGRKEGQGNTRKVTKFNQSFGKFPQCELELTEVGKDEKGKYKPYRWQRIMEMCPEFDIFIDDDKNKIREARESIRDKSKIYVLPDYRDCWAIQGTNVHHVKTTVSDLKDESFVKGAEEYKAKLTNQTETNKLTEEERANQSKDSDNKQTLAKPPNYPLWIGLGLGTIVLVGLICYFLTRKKNKLAINNVFK